MTGKPELLEVVPKSHRAFRENMWRQLSLAAEGFGKKQNTELLFQH